MEFEEPTLRAGDPRGVVSRTLVMLADDDEVTLEHAVEMYRSIPDAELAIIPGTSHGLLHEKPARCDASIIEFLRTDAVPTIAPIRRAPQGV
jgi:pimeloyl-ACP methyl ester carboxylesterase